MLDFSYNTQNIFLYKYTFQTAILFLYLFILLLFTNLLIFFIFPTPITPVMLISFLDISKVLFYHNLT